MGYASRSGALIPRFSARVNGTLRGASSPCDAEVTAAAGERFPRLPCPAAIPAKSSRGALGRRRLHRQSGDASAPRWEEARDQAAHALRRAPPNSEVHPSPRTQPFRRAREPARRPRHSRSRPRSSARFIIASALSTATSADTSRVELGSACVVSDGDVRGNSAAGDDHEKFPQHACADSPHSICTIKRI